MSKDIVIHSYLGQVQNIFHVPSRSKTSKIYQINYTDTVVTGVYQHSVTEWESRPFPRGNEILKDLKAYLKKKS